MPERTERWPLRLLILLIVAVVLGHVAWWHAYRAGGLLDIDEAAYLGTAFRASGPDHRVVTAPYLLWRERNYLAPLLALATLPFHYGIGRTLAASYLAVLAFLAALIGATYALARRFTGAWWALLAAVVVATLPGIADYARHYHFAVVATATFTIALLALVRAERFTHRGWSLAFGVALALVVLSRTIMLAFAPGLVLAALWSVLRARREDRRPSGVNLALALGVAALLAGSWYLPNLGPVWDYLTGWGYGNQSTYYGSASVASARFWLADLVALVSEGFYLPMALVLAAGAVTGLLTGVDRTPGLARRLADSDAFLVGLPLVLAFAALVSSRNQGTGFVLPLLPGAVVLAVALTSRARPVAATRAVAVVLLVVAATNVAMKTEVLPVETAGLEPAPWADLKIVDTSSVIARYAESYAGADDDATTEAWDRAVDEVLALSREHATDASTRLVVTVDGPLLNAPLLNLRAELDGDDDFEAGAVDASNVAPDDRDGLAAILDDLRAQGYEQVLTGPNELAWPGFALAERTTTAAAEAAGFTQAGAVTLPGGQIVTLWVAEDTTAEDATGDGGA